MAKFDTIVDKDTKEFVDFFQGCIDKFDAYYDRMGYTIPKDEFSFKFGPKNIKVVRGCSVHCFVDRTNGDVLKAASWKAPAKHARGNIFDKNTGLGSMGEFGPAYLK